MNNRHYARGAQSGFTIFELIIVMVVMSILATPFVYQQVQQFEEDRIEIAVAEINDLFQSAQNYAAEQDGDWPSEADSCSSAITVMEGANYLEGFSVRSPFGTNLTTSCTTGNGKRFLVTIDAVDAGNAELLDGYLPSSTVTGNLVTVSVPMPAAIPALQHLLPRDGSREMTGDLDMDDNNILNANRVETETVLLNSVVTKGSGCATNGMVARDSQGNLLSCVSGQWKGPEGAPANMVGYFNLASCPSGWVASNGANGTLDLRGEFIRGWDAGRGVDPARGRNTLQQDAMQNITGSYFSRSLRFQNSSASGAFYHQASSFGLGDGSRDNGSIVRFDASRVVRTATENRPRNRAMLVCQKQP